MATISLRVDDLDASVGTRTEADETIEFALDGKSYEIDLTSEHAAELRAALEEYIQAARRAGGSAKAPAKPKAKTDDEQNKAGIRAWARKQGHTVSDKGRIPADVMAAYEAMLSRAGFDRSRHGQDTRTEQPANDEPTQGSADRATTGGSSVEDAAVLAWAKDKGMKSAEAVTPAMRDKYLAAHAQ